MLEMDDFHLVRNSNDKEIKEMERSLALLGISDYSLIDVKLGKPHLDGGYQVNMTLARLTDDCTDRGNVLFTSESIG
jgi:hypothetical protein